jgi:hypothetical protein
LLSIISSVSVSIFFLFFFFFFDAKRSKLYHKESYCNRRTIYTITRLFINFLALSFPFLGDNWNDDLVTRIICFLQQRLMACLFRLIYKRKLRSKIILQLKVYNIYMQILLIRKVESTEKKEKKENHCVYHNAT